MDERKPGNRQLTEAEREAAKQILLQVRRLIKDAGAGDEECVWALRRYVYKQLLYDERGKPMQRKLLKLKKMAGQKGKCAACGCDLPETGAELDRLNAMAGYTMVNTRLLCHDCHRKMQAERGFA